MSSVVLNVRKITNPKFCPYSFVDSKWFNFFAVLKTNPGSVLLGHSLFFEKILNKFSEADNTLKCYTSQSKLSRNRNIADSFLTNPTLDTDIKDIIGRPKNDTSLAFETCEIPQHHTC